VDDDDDVAVVAVSGSFVQVLVVPFPWMVQVANLLLLQVLVVQ
jgi:hypothetical protein